MNNNNELYMGTLVETWMSHKKIKYITFNVTDDCNLACKYCYFTHKSSKKVMSLSIAQKAVSEILSNEDFLEFDGVVWDFIGGEPTLEVELIDKICDYILIEMFNRNHKWLYCYRFLIGTNGLLYSTSSMQKLIQKHGVNLQVALTIDGSKEKHDMSRVKKDGSGSYDDIVKQIPLWQKQQGGISTKATFAHDDLPYIKDSIINLWNLGIKAVMANVVFENVWAEGDDVIFKDQLIQLADYIVDNNLWNKYSVRFFDPHIGMPITEATKRSNFCGTGKMLAISTEGKYYPCVRFMDSAFNNHIGLSVGSIHDGWDKNRLRAFKALDTNTISSEECLNCEIASGCNWCSGFNYDDSETGTLFERKTYICKMHRANVEACKYLWKRYEEETGNLSPRRINMLNNASGQQKWLYIMADSNMASICNYQSVQSNDNVNTRIDNDALERILDFCYDNDYNPVFIGDVPTEFKKKGYTITSNTADDLSSFATCILVNHNTLSGIKNKKFNNVILSTSTDNICNLPNDIHELISNQSIVNVSIHFTDIDKLNASVLCDYQKVINQVSEILAFSWVRGRKVDINILTHIFHYDYHNECKAGTYSLSIAPNLRFYPCPAFYYDDENDWSIGSLNEGITNKYRELCKIEKSKLCNSCDSYHCSKCIYISKKMTNEFCVPSEELCIKSNIEREASRHFCEILEKNNMLNAVKHPVSSAITFLDPLLRW